MTTSLVENLIKPKFRGIIHQIAFYFYLALASLLLFFSTGGLVRISLALYLATLINMYGISSVLHITDWKDPEMELKVQKIDHASIFLLIAGTYTPICIACLNGTFTAMIALFTVWGISIVGSIKCLVWTKAPRIFNVLFYFLCGLTIIPFFPFLMSNLSFWQILLSGIGGGMYLAGGLIFASESPNPWPNSFGFHEIFHTLTILANIAFLVAMSPCIFMHNF